MTLEQFAERAALTEKTEVEKTAHLAYYFLQIKTQRDISLRDVSEWFAALHFSQPNFSRLEKRLKADSFVAGEKPHLLRLHANRIAEFRNSLDWLQRNSEEVVATNCILPEALYLKTRGYI